jgi:hypothetical protein
MTSMLRVNREIRSSKIAASRAASSSIGASLSEHVNGLAQGHEPDGDDTQRCQVGQAASFGIGAAGKPGNVSGRPASGAIGKSG